MIPAETIERIRKVVPRLSSDSEAEVLSSVAALRRILAKDGHDFHDLANEVGASPIYVDRIVYRDRPVHVLDEEDGWHTPDRMHIKAEASFLMTQNLRPHEADFVAQIMASARDDDTEFQMSVKQMKWWTRLTHRYRSAMAG